MLYRGPALEVLHEQYAAAGGWSTVVPAITDVRLPGGVAVDAPFIWRNGRARIRSRVAVVDPARELIGTGVSSGAKAVHRDALHPLAGQATRLDSEASMAGPLLTKAITTVAERQR